MITEGQQKQRINARSRHVPKAVDNMSDLNLGRLMSSLIDAERTLTDVDRKMVDCLMDGIKLS